MAGTARTLSDSAAQHYTLSSTADEYDTVKLPIGCRWVDLDAYGASVRYDHAEPAGTTMAADRPGVPASSVRRLYVPGGVVYIASTTASATYSIQAIPGGPY